MHLSVDASNSRVPASGEQLFQGIVTSPKRKEALNLAKDRFIEYKTVRNGVNMTPDPSLHEHTPHIIFDESLFHVMKNSPHEYHNGIIILERKPAIHSLLEDAKKTQVKALKDICGMRCESDNLDWVGGKFF
jgi:hypothetical protein